MAGYLLPVMDVADKDRGKHWALLLYFGKDKESWEEKNEKTSSNVEELDGDLYLCELTRFDIHGDILTSCEKITRKKILEKRKARRIYKLGPTRLTVEQLNEYVSSHENKDKKYNLLRRNCQHWVKILTEDLDLPNMFKANENYSTSEKTVYEYELLEGNYLGLSSGDSKALMRVNRYKKIISDKIDETAEKHFQMNSAEIKECLSQNVEKIQATSTYNKTLNFLSNIYSNHTKK